MKTVLYPGTFDPITNGHLDIIERAALLFDRVVVVVAINSAKETLFDLDERLGLIDAALDEKGIDRTRVDVVTIDGLLVDEARRRDAVGIVRGLRTLGDFEYEMQMAQMNRRLHGSISTLFIPADERYLFLNSSIVREIARHGADTGSLVPAAVARALREKFEGSRE